MIALIQRVTQAKVEVEGQIGKRRRPSQSR